MVRQGEGEQCAGSIFRRLVRKSDASGDRIRGSGVARKGKPGACQWGLSLEAGTMAVKSAKEKTGR